MWFQKVRLPRGEHGQGSTGYTGVCHKRHLPPLLNQLERVVISKL